MGCLSGEKILIYKMLQLLQCYMKYNLILDCVIKTRGYICINVSIQTCWSSFKQLIYHIGMIVKSFSVLFFCWKKCFQEFTLLLVTWLEPITIHLVPIDELTKWPNVCFAGHRYVWRLVIQTKGSKLIPYETLDSLHFPVSVYGKHVCKYMKNHIYVRIYLR